MRRDHHKLAPPVRCADLFNRRGKTGAVAQIVVHQHYVWLKFKVKAKSVTTVSCMDRLRSCFVLETLSCFFQQRFILDNQNQRRHQAALKFTVTSRACARRRWRSPCCLNFDDAPRQNKAETEASRFCRKVRESANPFSRDRWNSAYVSTNVELHRPWRFGATTISRVPPGRHRLDSVGNDTGQRLLEQSRWR